MRPMTEQEFLSRIGSAHNTPENTTEVLAELLTSFGYEDAARSVAQEYDGRFIESDGIGDYDDLVEVNDELQAKVDELTDRIEKLEEILSEVSLIGAAAQELLNADKK